MKTHPTDASVSDFLAALPDKKRADAQVVLALMQELSGEEPVLWGKGLIGFGRYDYTYASGKSGSWFRVGFSPRKTKLVLYLMPGFEEERDALSQLGKHSLGKSCLYVNKLEDIDQQVLRGMVQRSLDVLQERYG